MSMKFLIHCTFNNLTENFTEKLTALLLHLNNFNLIFGCFQNTKKDQTSFRNAFTWILIVNICKTGLKKE